MLTVTEAYCTKNKRYLANEPLEPKGIVLHSVGTPQPDARVFLKIWSEDRSPYMTHYVLDDARIFHTMPNNRRCWHVGAPGNSLWLGIEMCEPDSIRYKTGDTFDVLDKDDAAAFAKACYQNAVELMAALCKTNGWNPETDILTHGEITAKNLSNTTHVDPEHLWKGLSLPYSLNRLRADVRAAMGVSNTGSSAKQPQIDPAKGFDRNLAGQYEVTASLLNVRAGAGTDKPILTAIPRGTSVRNFGYYTDRSGRWLYVAFLRDGDMREGFCSAAYLNRK